MTVGEALERLAAIEEERKGGIYGEDMLGIGLARVSHPDQVIRAGSAGAMSKEDLGGPPHSLIIPGKLHFAESEAIEVLLRP